MITHRKEVLQHLLHHHGGLDIVRKCAIAENPTSMQFDEASECWQEFEKRFKVSLERAYAWHLRGKPKAVKPNSIVDKIAAPIARAPCRGCSRSRDQQTRS